MIAFLNAIMTRGCQMSDLLQGCQVFELLHTLMLFALTLYQWGGVFSVVGLNSYSLTRGSCSAPVKNLHWHAFKGKKTCFCKRSRQAINFFTKAHQESSYAGFLNLGYLSSRIYTKSSRGLATYSRVCKF